MKQAAACRVGQERPELVERVLQPSRQFHHRRRGAIITGRNATVSFSSPSDPVTPQNLPYDAAGNLIVARSLPRGVAFGVANAYQAPRSVHSQVRFSF